MRQACWTGLEDDCRGRDDVVEVVGSPVHILKDSCCMLTGTPVQALGVLNHRVVFLTVVFHPFIAFSVLFDSHHLHNMLINTFSPEATIPFGKLSTSGTELWGTWSGTISCKPRRAMGTSSSRWSRRPTLSIFMQRIDGKFQIVAE